MRRSFISNLMSFIQWSSWNRLEPPDGLISLMESFMIDRDFNETNLYLFSEYDE